jgi:hypothetical protein
MNDASDMVILPIVIVLKGKKIFAELMRGMFAHG